MPRWNRFGAVSELGVFEMTGTGLQAVPNPSQLFLAERAANVPGSAVRAASEDRVRLSSPGARQHEHLRQRAADDQRLDQNRPPVAGGAGKAGRLQLIAEDVFVNVAGGISIDEPAADLAIVGAVASSVRNRPIRAGTAVFGEVGLAGEIRATSQASLRAREAALMGFTRCIVPDGNSSLADVPAGCEIVGVRTVSEALDQLVDW